MPGLGGRLRRGAGLVEPEVVELADRRVAGAAQLAVDLGVLAADLRDGQTDSASAIIPSRHAQKSPPGALAAQRPLERMAVRVDEAGQRRGSVARPRR